MLSKQDNTCKICKMEAKVYHLDHCHKTGLVRGILCNLCNMMLGKARDDVSILKNAIDYLNTNAEKALAKERKNEQRK